jgi:predicted acyl esterase
VDGKKSTLWEPYIKQVVGPGEKLKPGEVVSCEIPILPSATLFHKGETLRLEISGLYRGGQRIEVSFDYSGEMVNKGTHTIYTGGKFDSHLLIPIVPPKTV